MHALMEGDDTSSGEEDGEEGEWGGIASSGGSSGAPSSAGAAGANSSGASAVSAVASGGKRTGTGKDEVLPADFDHELVRHVFQLNVNSRTFAFYFDFAVMQQ